MVCALSFLPNGLLDHKWVEDLFVLAPYSLYIGTSGVESKRSQAVNCAKSLPGGKGEKQEELSCKITSLKLNHPFSSFPCWFTGCSLELTLLHGCTVRLNVCVSTACSCHLPSLAVLGVDNPVPLLQGTEELQW